MKKLLSLFAISAITVTAAGNSVACNVSNKLKPIAPINTRKFNVPYKNIPIIPATTADWGKNQNYTVDLTKATATVGIDTFTGLYLVTGDKVKISFKPAGSGQPAVYTKPAITLAQVWKPIPGATTANFKIIFNKLNFVVKRSHEAAVEINIELITI